MRRLLPITLLLIACNTDATSPGLSFSVVSGDGQSGVVSQPLASPIVVQATDFKGRPQKNVQVTFVITSGGGSANPTSARTDHNGLAQTQWTLGTSTTQAQSLEARAGTTLLGAFSATPLPGPVAQLSISAGNGQSAVHDQPVAIAPAVMVQDQYANAVPNTAVTFSVTAGGGRVTGTPALSGPDGVATVGSWTLGGAIGTNTLAASTPGVAAIAFTATATAGPPAHMVLFEGNNQTATVMTAVPIPPAVRITDASGAPVAGVRPVFMPVTQGAVANNSPESDANGVARVDSWTLGSIAGNPQRLRVTASEIGDTVFFTATAIGGPTATITIRAGNNQVGYTNTALPTSPSVIARDAFNNVVPGATVTFAITEGSGTISAPNPVTTDANGIATVGGWVLGPATGTNQMTATADGAAPVTFTATAPTGPPASVAIYAGDNQTGFPNTVLPVRPAVIVRDAAGNPVGVIRVTFAVSSGDGDVSGATVGTTSSGVATVGGWELGPILGINTLSATVVDWPGIAGNPVTFTARAVGDAWTAAAPLSAARGYVGVAALGGKVYAVSGLTASTRVEEYDPVTNTWTARADMPTGRTGAVAAVNGLLYSAGGWNGGITDAFEAYDPLTNTWTARAPLPTRRYELSLSAVNGILYAIGGYTGELVCQPSYPGGPPDQCGWAMHMTATVEAYDPATDSWTTKAAMPTARVAHAAAVLNGLIYVVGGKAMDNNSWLSTVEAYDPSTNSWTTKASMPTGRFALGVGAVAGKLYAVGGEVAPNTIITTVEEYDPAANAWTTRAPLPRNREWFGMATLHDLLYVVGGMSYFNEPNKFCVCQVELVDVYYHP